MSSIFSLFLIVGFTLYAWGSSATLIQPPKGWDCINDPQQLPQKVKIIYIGAGNGNSQFTPSLNVACEATAMSLEEYVSLAKIYHEKQGNTRCTNMGKLNTASGPVEILQIDRNTQWGEVRFLQAMLINNGEAYVVTATCLKKDFGALSTHIVKAIQSLTIVENSQEYEQVPQKALPIN